MWTCKNCGANVDDVDTCWKCGLGKDGAVSTNTKSQSMKDEVARSNNITDYTSTYDTSRMIAKFISSIGWIVVGISVLIVLVSLLKSTGEYGSFALMGLVPALAGFISGLILVMTGQLTRAMIDTADHTGQMLSLMKKRK